MPFLNMSKKRKVSAANMWMSMRQKGTLTFGTRQTLTGLEAPLPSGHVFKAYSKEWKLGKKGIWECDDNQEEPVLHNAVDITAEERAAAEQAADDKNQQVHDFTKEEIQDLVFQEVNHVVDQLVGDKAVLDSGIHILVIVARSDTKGETGVHYSTYCRTK